MNRYSSLLYSLFEMKSYNVPWFCCCMERKH